VRSSSVNFTTGQRYNGARSGDRWLSASKQPLP